MQAILAGWKTRFLNIIGRTTLERACLSILPTHTIIDQIQRNFIWGSTSDHRKLHMISWEVVTKKKKEGGLGM
ncbi:hypothetical protein H5410_062805 [Solanum commersonii]|uniref:Uncharacterized protein n=1 Tax=Solanum commersonii TaxID=4109 RepID=A0A9J5WCJ4_SOLCO|nr:hypothetical protein H5410_062805 [Solanum commersonii]